MNKDTAKLASMVLLGIAGVMACTVFQQSQAVSAMPSADQWVKVILPAVLSAVAAAFGWKTDGGGGQTLNLLEALKRIIEQFKAKGIPDSMDMTLVWGAESYDLKWSKRTKVEPQK